MSTEKLLISFLAIPALFASNVVMAANPFIATCVLKQGRTYQMVRSLDNKSETIDEWSNHDNQNEKVRIKYTGKQYLDIEDSAYTRPIQARIVVNQKDTVFGLYVSEGTGGATTAIYAVNLKAGAIVKSQTQSGTAFGSEVRVGADGKSDCTFQSLSK